MANFNIKEYVDSLPNNVHEISVSYKNVDYLPDLSRFKNLEKLYCSSNNLTSLPILPENLKELYCSYNNLNYLSDLPKKL